MKKAVAFLIAIAICALTHPSLVLPGQKPASPPTAKLRRLNKAIAGQYIVVGAGDANVDASCTSPAHLAGAITVSSSTSTDSRTPFSNFRFSTWMGVLSSTGD